MKSNWQKKYKSDALIAIVIAVLPFLGYFHLLFSDELNTISLFGWEYTHVLPSNTLFVWYLLKNVISFALLLIWFVTLSMRWKYFLVPLFILYINDIMEILFEPYGKYYFYPFYFEHNPITIKILIMSFIIGSIYLFDFYYFKHYRRRLLEISIKSLLNASVRDSYNIYSQKLQSLIEKKDGISRTNYLKKIYNAKLILEDRLQLQNKTSGVELNSNKGKLNLLVIVLLVFTTLLWFSHYLIPEYEQVLDLGIVQVNNNGFDSVRIYLWFLLQKLIILIPMTLWFLTCHQWWKYAILSPIILYSYQFWEATQDVSFLDEAGNISAFPAIFCVVLLLLVISKAIKYRVQILIMYEQLTDEIENLFKNTDFRANTDLYKNVKQIKIHKAEIDRETNAEEQLIKLITLRDELVKQLKVNY
ncbi:hypothetical protein [Eudoraea adriatica]|uniref:hypothetical protein n=1 Tax=Eudoraea adriatica TaxID=446681 RepID=UPI0003798FE6|nr:hypothetical protein [Eudoraea adriatica]